MLDALRSLNWNSPAAYFNYFIVCIYTVNIFWSLYWGSWLNAYYWFSAGNITVAATLMLLRGVH